MNTPIETKRFDFTSVLKKVSTYVAALVSSAGAFMAWYLMQPEQVQQSVPEFLVTGAVMVIMLNVVGVPFATSFKQKNLG